MPGDSCIHQLISITHYASFDANPSLEFRSLFLDILKAFDRVWHEPSQHFNVGSTLF